MDFLQTTATSALQATQSTPKHLVMLSTNNDSKIFGGMFLRVTVHDHMYGDVLEVLCSRLDYLVKKLKLERSDAMLDI